MGQYQVSREGQLTAAIIATNNKNQNYKKTVANGDDQIIYISPYHMNWYDHDICMSIHQTPQKKLNQTNIQK